MNVVEVLVILALFLVMLVISGWLGHLLGLSPWILAVPATVGGLRLIFGGSWVIVSVALAVGVSLALFTTIPWSAAVAGAGATFYLVRYLTVVASRRRPTG
jgi:hypothetical protein